MLRSQFDSDMLLMEKNEIKKRLYKENQTATLESVRKDGILYVTYVDDKLISFLIPLGEVGEVVWGRSIQAKLLIRWLQ